MITDRYRTAIALAHILKKPWAGIFEAITEKYGSLEEAFASDTVTAETPDGKTMVTAIQPEKRKEALQFALEEEKFMERENIVPLMYNDDGYPKQLRECNDAPAVIYLRGNRRPCSPHMISIVGTRHATPYGKEFCEHLVADLAKAVPDIIICSGLAYGIDVCAHQAALQAGLPTVGVLAHGLDRLYPPPHRPIAAEMVKHGGGLLTGSQSACKSACDAFAAAVEFVADNPID